jgi:lipopolysaccharide/colanic/teichoic acid biosynthesis glycosyltransferase
MKSCGTALILAGGLADFGGLTLTPKPKSWLPIVNLPLYQYMGRILGATGVNRLIFCVPEGLGGEVSGLLSGSPPSLPYAIIETGLGSGGSVLAAADYIKGDCFWVVNGDLLLDADLTAMLAYHHARGALATAACMQIQEAPWWMERVETDTTHGIRAIHRMHPVHCKRSRLRPVGLYLFEKAVLDLIPPRRYFDLKEQLFPPLYEAGAVTGVWEVTGYCRTISSIEDYFFANQDVLLGRVTLPVNAAVPQDPVTGTIAPTAKVFTPAVIAASSTIGENALILGLTAIGPHCLAGSDAVINDCVFLGNASIGRGVYLDSCVVGEDITIADGTTLREVAILKGQSGKILAVPLALRESTNHSHTAASAEVNRRTPGRRLYAAAKRLFDLVLSSLGLLITAPLLLVIALAIKLDSKGDILFRQERCGLYGQRFTMYKFRTMVANSLEVMYKMHAFNEVDGPMFKMASDPRVTRVGRWLRNANLDEVPQLWNVMRGDMSLVGPRPLSMAEMKFNPKWRDTRLAVLPGMTGLWQVERRSQLNFSDWIHYDLEYIRKRSFWLDLTILFRTMGRLFPDFWQASKNQHKATAQAYCRRAGESKVN